MWDNIVRGHSSEFLKGPIHNAVLNNYYQLNKTDPSTYNFYKKNAEELQKYLYDLKNFRRDDYNQNIFEPFEYQVFLRVYSQINDHNGKTPLDNGFLGQAGITNTEKGMRFQKELINIQNALITILSGDFYLSSEEIKALTASMWLGTANSKIDFPDIQSPLTKELLEKIAKKTAKFIKTKKQKQAAKKVYKAQLVDPKIDIFTQGAKVDTALYLTFPNLARFASLYSNSTITAKNYKFSSIKKGVSLGKSNIFKIMSDFIPTLNLIDSREQEISFQYAIFKRYAGLAKQKISADNQIAQHFAHIANIYELMGVGQNFVDEDLIELKQLLKEGAEYLIINSSDSPDIFVKSTRVLISDWYNAKENISSLSKVGSFVKYSNLM